MVECVVVGGVVTIKDSIGLVFRSSAGEAEIVEVPERSFLEEPLGSWNSKSMFRMDMVTPACSMLTTLLVEAFFGTTFLGLQTRDMACFGARVWRMWYASKVPSGEYRT